MGFELDTRELITGFALDFVSLNAGGVRTGPGLPYHWIVEVEGSVGPGEYFGWVPPGEVENGWGQYGESDKQEVVDKGTTKKTWDEIHDWVGH